MKNLFILILLIISSTVFSQTIDDDGYFVVPQYIVTGSPRGLIFNQMHLLKKMEGNEYYKSTDSLITLLKGKSLISVCFVYMYERIFTQEYLSFIDKGRIYCLEKKSGEIIPFKEIFKNYYGNIERFKQSKTFYNEIENFKQEYQKWDTIKMRTYLNYLESLNFMTKNTYPTDSFVKTFQEYIYLNPTEVEVLKYCYNKFIRNFTNNKIDNIERDHLIEIIIENALSPKNFIKFKFNKNLIYEKEYLLTMYLDSNVK